MNTLELKIEMLKHNVTQADLAEAIKKSGVTMTSYMKEETVMSLDDAKIISDFLNLSNERRAEIFLN